MPIVSRELDIFNLYPKKRSVPSSYPINIPEIDYVATSPPAQLVNFPSHKKVHPIHDANPQGPFGGVPIHIVRPMDTQFNAPLVEGNALGSSEQLLQAAYLNQLLPTDVNMNARVNETGIYPYFMNTLQHLENMIKAKPMAASEPNKVETVEPQLPPQEMAVARNMDLALSPGEEPMNPRITARELVERRKAVKMAESQEEMAVSDIEEQMKTTGRGGARKGAGRKPKTIEDIRAKEMSGQKLNKSELRRLKKG